ncbi:cell division protein ZapA [bacterium BMS3Abin05]|nr:cell division protein ZapA [bacterium BMS3Abin05]GBE27354.1 cell division protein ZapA [bacterium BMS3Bbin03]HDL78125.1 cell division protein ZapA [Bacteroidota bacterium]HDZ11814.1 cell division protein ZapA [Bacteroidota bacterium]
MTEEKRTLKVNIYGTEYPIRGQADVDYILKVADYLDQKMREIDQQLSQKSALKVAILAALNITDELFRNRLEKAELVEKYERKIQELLNLLGDISDSEASVNF